MPTFDFERDEVYFNEACSQKFNPVVGINSGRVNNCDACVDPRDPIPEAPLVYADISPSSILITERFDSQEQRDATV